MYSCWNLHPGERPTFSKIVHTVEQFVGQFFILAFMADVYRTNRGFAGCSGSCIILLFKFLSEYLPLKLV